MRSQQTLQWSTGRDCLMELWNENSENQAKRPGEFNSLKCKIGQSVQSKYSGSSKKWVRKLWFTNSTHCYIPNRIERRISKGCLCIHIHCNLILISKTMDITQESSEDEWICKDTGGQERGAHMCVYGCDSLKKEGNSDICCNIEETRGYAKKLSPSL